MNKKPGNGSIKRAVLIAIIVLLAIILAVLVVGTAFVTATLNKIERVDPAETLSQEEIESILNEEIEETTPDFTGEVINSEDLELPEEPVEVVETGDEVIQILLVGQDTKSMSSRSRTDSMILCTVNLTDKTLTMTSFMRDMYLKLPGYQSQRLNVAYLLGGFDALYNALEYNFGVQADYGVAVNFASFQKVIDAVGGVDVELTSREATHLNLNYYGFNLTEGLNHLNGEAALAYSRIRKLDSDFNRTNRQRTVMMALLEKAKTLPATELYDLVETLIPMVVTDMTNSEIIDVAFDIVPILGELQVISQRIPIDGEYRNAWVDGMAVLLPDLEANRQYLVDTIGNKE